MIAREPHVCRRNEGMSWEIWKGAAEKGRQTDGGVPGQIACRCPRERRRRCEGYSREKVTACANSLNYKFTITKGSLVVQRPANAKDLNLDILLHKCLTDVINNLYMFCQQTSERRPSSVFAL